MIFGRYLTDWPIYIIRAQRKSIKYCTSTWVTRLEWANSFIVPILDRRKNIYYSYGSTKVLDVATSIWVIRPGREQPEWSLFGRRKNIYYSD